MYMLQPPLPSPNLPPSIFLYPHFFSLFYLSCLTLFLLHSSPFHHATLNAPGALAANGGKHTLTYFYLKPLPPREKKKGGGNCDNSAGVNGLALKL